MMQVAVISRALGAVTLLAMVLAGWMPDVSAQTSAGARSSSGSSSAASRNRTSSQSKAAAGSEPPTLNTTAMPTAAGEQEIDGIVAVVNKDIITQRELNTRVRQAKGELSLQKVPLPPDSVLETQILQRLINERLQAQEAARQKIVVTDDMVKQAIDMITTRNKVTADQMRKQIEASGVTWDEYRTMIRREITLERLRQKVIDSTIVISDAEVDANLREQKARQEGGLASLARPGGGQPQAAAPVRAAPQAPSSPGQPAVLGLAQILVRVPEGASPDQVKSLRERAQALLARIKAGESFEKVATSSSDGSEAARGGDMGARPVDAWPDLFVNAVANVKDGGVSSVIQSGNGFHILKVMGRAGGAPTAPAPAPVAPAPPPQQAQPDPGRAQPPAAPQGPMNVEQTHAHHILIKTSEVVPDDIARQKLMLIYDRIVKGGESFEDLAKRFSNDASAPQGGDLGWLNPGETVPPFEKVMNALKVGEVSQPVKTQFGWHIIRVDDRRTRDIAEQFQRNQARQRLFQQRSEASFDAWLQQVRNQSYIDNRLEKRQKQEKE